MLSSRGQCLYSTECNTIQCSSCVMQIKLLRVLGHLGSSDKQASDNMYSVVAESMRRGNTGHTIGNAIVYEAVRTIASIYPNPALLQSGEGYLLPQLQCRGTHSLCRFGTIPCIRLLCEVSVSLVQTELHTLSWQRGSSCNCCGDTLILMQRECLVCSC